MSLASGSMLSAESVGGRGEGERKGEEGRKKEREGEKSRLSPIKTQQLSQVECLSGKAMTRT